jgi:hypothetical protein
MLQEDILISWYTEEVNTYMDAKEIKNILLKVVHKNKEVIEKNKYTHILIAHSLKVKIEDDLSFIEGLTISSSYAMAKDTFVLFKPLEYDKLKELESYENNNK